MAGACAEQGDASYPGAEVLLTLARTRVSIGMNAVGRSGPGAGRQPGRVPPPWTTGPHWNLSLKATTEAGPLLSERRLMSRR